MQLGQVVFPPRCLSCRATTQDAGRPLRQHEAQDAMQIAHCAKARPEVGRGLHPAARNCPESQKYGRRDFKRGVRPFFIFELFE